MKKIIITALVAIVSFTAFSQSDSGEFTIATQVGVNLSTYVISGDGSFNSRTSFTVGAAVDYYFSDRWSLRTGLIYDTKGAKGVLNFEDKLSYMTVPVNANWHFGGNRNWYLNFGPAVSLLVDAKSETPDGQTVDIKDAVKGIDLGFALGIGYKFNLSDDVQLVIDYQGLGGLTDLVDFDNNGVSLKNSRSAFNVGAIFGL